MWSLAFRNIFRHRFRAGATLLAMVVGVVCLISAGGFVNDIFYKLREGTIRSELGHIQVFAEGYLTHGRVAPYQYMIPDDDPIGSRLAALAHVKYVIARLKFSALLSNGVADLPVIGEGVEPEKENQVFEGLQVLAGERLASAQPYGVMLGEGVARALDVTVGDTVMLLVTTPEGAMNTLDLDVVGVFRTLSKEYDARAVRVVLSSAKDLLLVNSVHSYTVFLSDTRFTDAVVAQIRRMTGDGTYEVRSWEQLAGFYQKVVAMYDRQFGALVFVVLLMVVLAIVNSINISVRERMPEFGTLLVLGFKARQLVYMIFAESLLLGAVGAGIGVVFGGLVAVLASWHGIEMPAPPNMNEGYMAEIRLNTWILTSSALVAWLASVLAAVWPAMRMRQVQPTELLKGCY